ncbi:multidrug DMT transporter (plasmid) [Agrobacterium vitis]|uniref:DMT family transporter n=1 Tax=Agrobacterium vitis TaxID=373 RepID=UPI0015D9E0AD|nr:DMT family transporter [Agrobacterium vitis]BCH67483.1 multidrug DMT transporter [Agrobacterium vitis]
MIINKVIGHVKILRPLAPVAASLLAVLIWAAWFPITKLAVNSQLNEWQLCFIRFLVSGIVAVPILIRKGFGVTPKVGGVARAIVISVCAGVGYVSLATLALEFAPSIYGMVTPVSMATSSTVLAILLSGRKVNSLTIFSFFLFALGLVFLANGENPSNPDALVGIALFVAAGIFFSVYNIAVSRWSLDPFHATALVSFYSLIIVAPIGLWQFGNNMLSTGWPELALQAFYQGVLVSYVALILFTYAIKRVGAGRASYLALLVPATSVLLSALLLGEKADSAVMVSVCLLVIGMSLGIIGQSRLGRKQRAV